MLKFGNDNAVSKCFRRTLADAPFAVDRCKELANEYTEALQSGAAG